RQHPEHEAAQKYGNEVMAAHGANRVRTTRAIRTHVFPLVTRGGRPTTGRGHRRAREIGRSGPKQCHRNVVPPRAAGDNVGWVVVVQPARILDAIATAALCIECISRTTKVSTLQIDGTLMRTTPQNRVLTYLAACSGCRKETVVHLLV